MLSALIYSERSYSTMHFNRRTAEPLEGAPPPGCDEPTSRCQTAPSMWTIGRYKPVIPRVTFIRFRFRSHIHVHKVRKAVHLLRLSSLLEMYFSQSSWLMRIHYHFDFHPKLANLWTPPLLFRRQPPQLNYPPYTVPLPDNGNGEVKLTTRVVFHLSLHKY